MNNIHIDLQFAEGVDPNTIPSEEIMCAWLQASLEAHANYQNLDPRAAELSIRIVEESESAKLNQQYRQKSHSTNVLSFPADLPDIIESPLLGDLLICAPVVEREALEQNKKREAHWAHMVVHGTLHLLGYDHILDQEAVIMENLENNILNLIGFESPYE